jgi:membrane-bound metal-dependent hydrolase YbcI (DUF457 family)
MDIPTHGLMAGVLAAAAFPHHPDLTLCFVAGSVAPDLDLLLRFYDRATFLRLHQGLTHSLPGISMVASASALMAWCVTGQWYAPTACLIFAAGMLFHSVLDVTNTFGLMVFAPFSRRRMCTEWLFCVDAFATLTSGVALACVLWADAEDRWRLGAGYLVCFLAYWVLHARLRSAARRLAPVGTSSLIPTSVLPWVFLGCISRGGRATTFRLNVRTGRTSELAEWRLFDDEYGRILETLPEFRSMRALSALYHVVAKEQVSQGTLLLCKDLRIRNFGTRFGELRVMVEPNGRASAISFRV